jgi:hypothetical protein
MPVRLRLGGRVVRLLYDPAGRLVRDMMERTLRRLEHGRGLVERLHGRHGLVWFLDRSTMNLVAASTDFSGATLSLPVGAWTSGIPWRGSAFPEPMATRAASRCTRCTGPKGADRRRRRSVRALRGERPLHRIRRIDVLPGQNGLAGGAVHAGDAPDLRSHAERAVRDPIELQRHRYTLQVDRLPRPQTRERRADFCRAHVHRERAAAPAQLREALREVGTVRVEVANRRRAVREQVHAVVGRRRP